MDFPSKTKTINGHEYTVSHLSMRKWFELETLVLKDFGPSIGEFLFSASNNPSNDAAIMASTLYQLAQDAKADTHEKLVKELSRCTIVDGENLGNTYENWWPNHMIDLAEFVQFALEVQFGDFLAGLGIVKKLRKKSVQPSTEESK